MIIGLCGKKGCGKSSFAKFAEELGFVTLSFATPLKDALHAMGISREMLDDPKLKESPTSFVYGGLTPRQLLQYLGTEFGRKMVSESIWVDHLIDRMRNCQSDKFVIDDVRFDNEAEAIKFEGGTIIEIVRDDSFYKSNDLHPSEHGVSDHLIDETYKNISCYSSDLKIGVESMINKIEVERMSHV